MYISELNQVMKKLLSLQMSVKHTLHSVYVLTVRSFLLQMFANSDLMISNSDVMFSIVENKKHVM